MRQPDQRLSGQMEHHLRRDGGHHLRQCGRFSHVLHPAMHLLADPRQIVQGGLCVGWQGDAMYLGPHAGKPKRQPAAHESSVPGHQHPAPAPEISLCH
jgi:hypothetical protein